MKATTAESVKVLLSELSVIVTVASARLESDGDLGELLARIRQSVSFEVEYFLKEKYSPEDIVRLPYNE